MRRTKQGMTASLRLALIGLLITMGLQALPAAAATDSVHQLAGAPSRFASTEGRDYRLAAVHPKMPQDKH